jgi:hypothetical protein
MRPQIVIAFLTGQSDPKRCALSPEQASFLAQLGGTARELIPLNFPFTPTAPFRETSLPRASWNNIRLTLSSHRRSFAARHRDAVAALIERGPRTVFLAGSCGLELFNHLGLSPELESRCTLLCYGPVARRLPRHASAVIVQGSRDVISRTLFRHPGRRLRCNHLGYLRDPEFLRLCQDELSLVSSAPCISTFA